MAAPLLSSPDRAMHVPLWGSGWLRLRTALAVCGAALLALNVYGQLRSLRHADLAHESRTRFVNDLRLSLPELQQALEPLPAESKRDYALRATVAVRHGIAHLEWNSPEATKYYLRVPPWENFVLYALSYAWPAEYERYHFRNDRLTVERGVGVCGDAACVLAAQLERQAVPIRLVAFPDHVVVEANIGDQAAPWWTLDPDFGVTLRGDAAWAAVHAADVEAAYRAAGHSGRDAATLARIYRQPARRFSSAFAFSPNLSRVESVSYLLKWLLPLALLAPAVWSRIARRRFTSHAAASDRPTTTSQTSSSCYRASPG